MKQTQESYIWLMTSDCQILSQASDVDQFLDDLFMPVLDGNQAGDDGLSDARSLAASMRGGGGDGDEMKRSANDAETTDDEAAEDVRILTFSRSGSLRRESILRQGMADLEQLEFNDALDDVIGTLEIIRGGGRDSPTNSAQNKTPVGFQPIPGMISPTGMMSPPPPMLMPTPLQAGNPQQLMLQMPQGGVAGAGGGAGAEQQPAMAFTYVPVPVYNMSGVSLPGMAPHSGTVSPVKTTAEDKSDGAKKQSEDSSDQVQQQQMYQQAFLQNAVAQNMQVSQSIPRPCPQLSCCR